jgi:ribosomal protein L40E
VSKTAAVANAKPVAPISSPAAERVDRTDRTDRTERELGRAVALGLPVVTVGTAIAIGFMSSLGPAILILAAGVLLGTIALLWASVRTLSGDAPLPEDLEAFAARRHSVDAVAERKSTVLRAIKDLEHEHFVGKIDDADYEQISNDYRSQAKDLMREMDADVEPLRARAEELARSYLKKQGLDEAASPKVDDESEEPVARAESEPQAPSRIECAECSVSNEPDATFCKKCGAALSRGNEEESDASA